MTNIMISGFSASDIFVYGNNIRYSELKVSEKQFFKTNSQYNLTWCALVKSFIKLNHVFLYITFDCLISGRMLYVL